MNMTDLKSAALGAVEDARASAEYARAEADGGDDSVDLRVRELMLGRLYFDGVDQTTAQAFKEHISDGLPRPVSLDTAKRRLRDLVDEGVVSKSWIGLRLKTS
jgi:hypothetical protein